MRTNLGKKWQFLPLPVVVIGSYNKAGKPNAMTAAWATVYDYGQVFVSMGDHLTKTNILSSKAFTIAFATRDTIKYADYFGLVSGAKEDKIKKSNVHVIKSKYVNAPIIQEFPVVLECKLVSLKDGNLIGDIVNVSVDNKYIHNKKIDTTNMNLVVYDMSCSSYKIIGKEIATAFSCGKTIKNK